MSASVGCTQLSIATDPEFEGAKGRGRGDASARLLPSGAALQANFPCVRARIDRIERGIKGRKIARDDISHFSFLLV